MRNSSHTEDDSLAELSKYIGELMDLALNRPEEAIPRIETFNSRLVDSGVKPNESVPFLCFLAYGKLASQKAEESATSPKDIVALCQKSLSQYRLALELAQYETTEIYQEEVVVKPAGVFRKAETGFSTRTRTVTKSRLDPKLVAQPLDHVCRLIENYSPGDVHKILGEVKLKYLGSADHLFWAAAIQGAIENGLCTNEDLLSISELAVTASGPIRSVFVSLLSGGSEPKFLLTFFDKPEPFTGSNTNAVGMCTVEKKKGVWSIAKDKQLSIQL